MTRPNERHMQLGRAVDRMRLFTDEVCELPNGDLVFTATELLLAIYEEAGLPAAYNPGGSTT